MSKENTTDDKEVITVMEDTYNKLEKLLNEMLDSGIFDATTYDLMKVYLKDEEEDMGWSEQQLDLIKMIGKENYLTQLLINGVPAE